MTQGHSALLGWDIWSTRVSTVFSNSTVHFSSRKIPHLPNILTAWIFQMLVLPKYVPILGFCKATEKLPGPLRLKY